MQEIRGALAAGKDVITHTGDISVSGWTGAGYIIVDPVTGDSAYKIGGGENGSFITVVAIFGLAVALAAIIPFIVTGALIVLFAWLPVILTGIGIYIAALYSVAKNWTKQQWEGFPSFFKSYYVAGKMIWWLLIAFGVVAGGSFALIGLLSFILLDVTGATPQRRLMP